MADDIWTLLSYDDPTIKNIYVIDLFDPAYVPGVYSNEVTIENQRNAICRFIIDGNNDLLLSSDDYYKPAKLKYKGTITSNKCTDDGAWVLDFTFGPRNLKLVVYSGNFRSEEWPVSITNISHVFMNGAGSWTDFVPNPENTPAETANFIKMMTERTKFKYVLTTITFLHEHFPHRFTMLNRHGHIEELSSTTVTKLPNGSLNLKKVIPQDYIDGVIGIDKYGDIVPRYLLTDPEHNSKPTVSEIMTKETVDCNICGKKLSTRNDHIVLTRIGNVYCSNKCINN
jgi:hypothetical protein